MTKKRVPRQINIFLPVLIFGLAFPLSSQTKAFPEGLQTRQAPNPVRIVDSNEQSIVVELAAGRPHIETIPQQGQNNIPDNQTDLGVHSNRQTDRQTDRQTRPYPPDTIKNHEAQSYHRFTIDGMAMMTKPGAPQLSVYGSLFGVASLDGVSLQILDAEYETLHGYHIPPAPSFPVNSDHYLDVQDDTPRENYPNSPANEPDERLYAKDAFYPGVLAELGHTGHLRDQPVAQAQWYPLQYNPVTGDVRFYRRIRARITWNSPLAPKTSPSRYGSPAFETLLKNVLVNYRELNRVDVDAINDFRKHQGNNKSPVTVHPPLTPPRRGISWFPSWEGSGA